MKDFILSALPFIIIGICLAIIFANNKKKHLLLRRNGFGNVLWCRHGISTEN